MVVVHPTAERRGVGRQVFKPHPEFLRRLEFALPVIIGSDRSVDLGTGGEAGPDRTAGQPGGYLVNQRPAWIIWCVYSTLMGGAKVVTWPLAKILAWKR